MSSNAGKNGIKNPFYGKIHSNESKAKMSNAAKKRTKKRNAVRTQNKKEKNQNIHSDMSSEEEEKQ